MIFPNLSQTWNIIILIILILLSLYFVLFIVNLVFVISFSKKIRRDNRGIRVSLSTKLDILRRAQEVILANEIKLTEKCMHSLRYLDSEDFLEVQKDEFIESTSELSMVEKEISGIIFTSRKLSKDDEVELLRSLLKDVNNSLKALILAYNYDVLGYNFWISFTPCKFIFFTFNVKKKRTIQ